MWQRPHQLILFFKHFGSPEHHFHTISSPLATQIPQAAGVGYALRRDPNRRSKSIAACFFGEGAASEGGMSILSFSFVRGPDFASLPDFHAGLMLASTVPSPVLYIARNNGFAISTPSTEQYNGDGIASRGPGYGIDTVRVDGNDILAVITTIRKARKRCLEQGRAVLVEAMTYRHVRRSQHLLLVLMLYSALVITPHRTTLLLIVPGLRWKTESGLIIQSFVSDSSWSREGGGTPQLKQI